MRCLLRALRWLLRRPQPLVERERAIQLACEEAGRRNWPYHEPIAVEELKTWLVWLDSTIKGGGYVVIDQQTGEVAKAGRIPR